MAIPSVPEHVVGTRDWLGFMVMVVGMFMAILDIQIVSSSLTEIQAGLSASADEISWVQTSYLIAEVIMIPLSGFLSRLLSTRVLFTCSAAGFTLMSLACSFADSMPLMVVARALQGFIGGAMIPTVFATSFILFPLSKRPLVSTLIGLVATMAPTLGPTLGGWLTEHYSWHWLFLINIAPGLLVTVTVWLLVDVDRGDRSLLNGFDWPGLILMAIFLGSLEFVVEEGPRNDWLNDNIITIFSIITSCSAVMFFWRVLIAKNPIVQLRAFADRNFAMGCLFSFILGIGLYGSVYLLPLFLAQVRGLNSLQIGQIMFVTGTAQFLSAPLAGALSRHIDLRLMLAFGFALFATGLWWNAQLNAQSDFNELLLPQAVRGFALMFCFIPINTLSLGRLPPDKLKNASGLYNLMRNLGGAIGLAVINTLIQHQFALHLNRLGDFLDQGRPVIQDSVNRLSLHFEFLAVDNPTGAAMATLARLVRREATVMTFSDCLLTMAAVFVFGLVVMPLLRGLSGSGGPPVVAHE
ncbi:MAG: DHA2 family efflux MFS transporter permease subunit [Rhodospirillaceae bacterium]